MRSVLESYPDVEVVGEAWNGEEAVAFAITARNPHIVVIGLSVQVGGANEEEMKKAGAAMLLNKEAAVDELYRAIRERLGLKSGKALSAEWNPLVVIGIVCLFPDQFQRDRSVASVGHRSELGRLRPRTARMVSHST